MRVKKNRNASFLVLIKQKQKKQNEVRIEKMEIDHNLNDV